MLTVHHHPSPRIAAGLTSLMMVADGKYIEAVECQGKEFAKKKLESLGHAQVLIIVEGVAANVTSTYNTIGCLTAASISAREKQYKKDVSALAEVHKELSIVPAIDETKLFELMVKYKPVSKTVDLVVGATMQDTLIDPPAPRDMSDRLRLASNGMQTPPQKSPKKSPKKSPRRRGGARNKRKKQTSPGAASPISDVDMPSPTGAAPVVPAAPAVGGKKKAKTAAVTKTTAQAAAVTKTAAVTKDAAVTKTTGQAAAKMISDKAKMVEMDDKMTAMAKAQQQSTELLMNDVSKLRESTAMLNNVATALSDSRVNLSSPSVDGSVTSDAMSCVTKMLTDNFNNQLKSVSSTYDMRIVELKAELEDMKKALLTMQQQLIAKTEEAAAAKAMATEKMSLIAEIKADKQTWFQQADSMRKDMKDAFKHW